MRLMPACLPLRLQELVVTAGEVTLMLVSGQSAACCPLCAEPSTRVHSRYTRTLADLPWGPLRVHLHVQVRRFFCQNPACPRKIFTEPLTGLAERSARRTTRLRDALLAVGWALGGEAGARQCQAHTMPISGTTLLSLLRRWGPVTRSTPRVLGVDDWSATRSRMYSCKNSTCGGSYLEFCFQCPTRLNQVRLGQCSHVRKDGDRSVRKDHDC
jgi:transposase